MSRKTPAKNVEMRVRAPEAFTLITVWPIIAQPPMPPKKPENDVRDTLRPTPHGSCAKWVSVISSTSFAVIRDFKQADQRHPQRRTGR